MKRPSDDEIDRIEKQRFDAVSTVIPQFDTIGRVPARDLELEQQFARL